MALTLGNCATCGRVYNTRHGSEVCADCYLENEAARALVETSVQMRKARCLSEIAADTRLDKTRVRKILRDAPVLARDLEPEGTCSQCGEREALASSGRCVGCQLALYKSLGDVVADVTFAPRIKPSETAGRMHVLAAVQEKRRRTGSYRFNATPQSIKGAIF